MYTGLDAFQMEAGQQIGQSLMSLPWTFALMGYRKFSSDARMRLRLCIIRIFVPVLTHTLPFANIYIMNSPRYYIVCVLIVGLNVDTGKPFHMYVIRYDMGLLFSNEY